MRPADDEGVFVPYQFLTDAQTVVVERTFKIDVLLAGEPDIEGRAVFEDGTCGGEGVIEEAAELCTGHVIIGDGHTLAVCDRHIVRRISEP